MGNRKAETHIRVTEETWKRLNRRKGPGDTFDSVIVDLLDSAEGGDAQGGDSAEPDGGGRGVRPCAADGGQSTH